jgi:hypothetical protein
MLESFTPAERPPAARGVPTPDQGLQPWGLPVARWALSRMMLSSCKDDLDVPIGRGRRPAESAPESAVPRLRLWLDRRVHFHGGRLARDYSELPGATGAGVFRYLILTTTGVV